MRLRNRAYDRGLKSSRNLGRPTISVGNITAGGTGKTPVVHWVASMLQAMGDRPAILMRGYRKSGSTLSDEQALLESQLPGVIVMADADRVAGAAEVLRRDPSVNAFILDDGFQHRRAQRQFDLVLIHAADPFGFGHVHPRGLLREPLAGLSRATALLVTHASEVPAEELLKTQEHIRAYTRAPIFHCDHVNTEIISPDGAVRELSDLATMPFVLTAGIGKPDSLADSLRRFASAYRGDRFFDDHHHYSAGDVAALLDLARERGAKAVVTTEKDWVKLKPLWTPSAGGPTLYRLRLQIRFWEDEETPFAHMIREAM